MDLFKWEEAIKNHDLISAETTALAFADHTLNNGDPIHYGYGWHVKELDGALSFQHGGSIFGFKSMGVYFSEEDIYVVGLSNCDCNSPTQITRDIAEMVLHKNNVD